MAGCNYASTLVQQLLLALPGVWMHEAGNGRASLPIPCWHSFCRTCKFSNYLGEKEFWYSLIFFFLVFFYAMYWLKVVFIVTEGTCIRENEPHIQLHTRPMWTSLHNNRRWWKHWESWCGLCWWPWEVSFSRRQHPRDRRIMPFKLYFWPCERQVLLGQTTWLECLQREQLRPWNPWGIYSYVL